MADAGGINLGSVYGTLEIKKGNWDSEIKKVDDQLQNLEKKSTGSLEGLGKSFTQAGVAMSAGLTVPLTVFGKTAIDTFIDIEYRWKEVEKVYGSTAGAFKRDNKLLADSVDNLSVKFGFQKEQVLDTLSSIAAIGYEGSGAIDVLTQSIEFARTGNMGLNEALDYTVAISKIYGVEGDKLRLVLAKLNAVENTSAASMKDLGVAITTSGSAAKGAGVGVESLSAIMAVLRERGVEAGEGANALKTIFTRLRTQAVPDLEAIGIKVEMNNGKLKAGDTILVELAKKWGKLSDAEKEEIAASSAGLFQKDKFLTLMDGLSQSGGKYSEVLKNISNETGVLTSYQKEMNVFLETNKTKVEQANVAWTNLRVAVGGILADVFIPISQRLAEMAKSFSELDPRVQRVIVIFGLVLAALGPLLIVIGQAAIGFSVISTAITGLFTVISAAIPAIVGFVAAFWPLILVGIVVAGIALLIWKNWDTLGPLFKRIMDTIIEFGKTVIKWLNDVYIAFVTWGKNLWAWLSTEIPRQFREFVKWVSELPARAVTALSDLGASLRGAFIAGWNAVVTEVSQWPSRLYDWGKNIMESFVNGLKAAAGAIAGAFKSGLDAAKGMVKSDSPPKEGPFKEIDVWGFNTGLTWAQGVADGMKYLQPAMSLAVSAPTMTTESAPAPIQQAQGVGSQFTVNLNIGMYAGSEMEKREIARQIFSAHSDLMKLTGV